MAGVGVFDAAVETEIPEDLLPQYRRTIASLGPDGMSAVKERTCTACYTEIIDQYQYDLEQDRFVVCSSCGRISSGLHQAMIAAPRRVPPRTWESCRPSVQLSKSSGSAGCSLVRSL